MIYLFELSKEHETLPYSEIVSCLKGENIKYNILESNENILLLETSEDKKLKNIFSRLSLSFYIDSFLFSCSTDIKDIKSSAQKTKISKKGTISIKCKNRSEKIRSQKIIKTLAEVLTENREVDLSNPDIEIRAFITDSKVYVGIKLFEIDRTQFEKRKVQFRPFFSPISLHPKIARVLVNLSCIKKNEVLLDPFCGTGGILIEAGLMGIHIVGSDIEDKMINGCKKTLDFYNIKNYKLFNTDIGKINQLIGGVDAVVTDFPYGKSTTTKGEKMHDLYDRAFKNISKVFKKNCRAVIGIPNEDLIPIGNEYMKFKEAHKLRAHRSLTRFFVIYEKQP